MLQFTEDSILLHATGKEGLAMEIATLLTSSTFHNVFGKMNAASRVSFLRATSAIKASLEESDESQAAICQTLESGLFVRLCELLPRALRKTIKALAVARSSNEVVDPRFLIEFLLPLTRKFATFDLTSVDARDSTCIASTLRACLKYGMTASNDTSCAAITSQRCLRLARSFVIGIPVSAVNNFPSPSAVYEMIVSHSHFAEAITNANIASEYQKLQLVNLMLACASLSKSPLTVGTDIWKILFRAYGAGLGAADSSLRRFFFVVSKRQNVSLYIPLFGKEVLNAMNLFSQHLSLFSMFLG